MVAGVALAVAAAGMAGAQSQGSGLEAAPPPAVQALVENCDAHKFETVIRTTVGGEIKHSKVKLCGTEGQSDADWLKTLRDAVEKTAANPQMPQAVKDQIIAAVKLEIVRLGGSLQSAPQPVQVVAIPGADLANVAPKPRAAPPAAPLDRDYAALPPLSSAPPPPPRLIVPGSPPLARPKLSFECLSPSAIGDGPCTAFERDTLVTVSAGENLPSGTSLRFVRGDASADVELAGLARGKSMQFALPREVCAGVGGGKLEVQIVRTAGTAGTPEQVVGSEGPYNLRC